MRKLVGAIVILVALLAWAGEVQAACTSTTIFMPDGKVMFCTTCCYGGSCTTHCY